MFLGDSDTLAACTDALKMLGVSQAPGWLSSMNTRAHARAYNTILGTLLARGYTKAQVDSWDRGGEFESDLTVYFALSWGGATESLDPAKLAAFDRREELKEAQVYAAGVLLDPAGSAGQVTTGTYSTAEDTFVWPDPEDPQKGQVARW